MAAVSACPQPKRLRIRIRAKPGGHCFRVFMVNSPALGLASSGGVKHLVFVYRVNRYPPTRLEADRCCKVAVGRGGAEVRRKSASTVWRALGGNDPFGLCRGFLPGTSSWRRDSRFP